MALVGSCSETERDLVQDIELWVESGRVREGGSWWRKSSKGRAPW